MMLENYPKYKTVIESCYKVLFIIGKNVYSIYIKKYLSVKVADVVKENGFLANYNHKKS